ncbi:membrane fusion protein, multidrug efflux system [Hyphomicrobium sp. 1Nfss2.1]|uniref:efflux RND transporter periplasmic adaptor subunit n=1 Tax=Hyphomicrobium sp. 1Nfss2.1 TaxID=3413936 RepID=UPI003C7A1324
MRPSYIVLFVALCAALAVAALGPMRGRSIEAGLDDAREAMTSTLARFGGDAPPKAPQAPKPPELTVSQPVKRDVIEWDEYTGRFDAVEAVEIRARVSGYLTEVKFTDGETVKAGDLLFMIDPRPYERALEQAQAQLNQAKVSVSNAKLDVERGRPLLKSDYISRKAFDDRENLLRDAQALVIIAEARVKSAELDLSFCRVTAPISGRISRTLVTPGNFVSGGGSNNASTVLTTIVSQDPIYIYFDVSENNALKYQRMSQAAGKGATGMIGAQVGVGLPDEEGFPHEAKLDFLENRLDQGTGTLRARAVLANADYLFSPGMFARVRLQGSPQYSALLLPDEAIATDQATRFVYVVGDDDIPVRRPVELGPLDGGMRIIRDGLKPDDWVVLRGQQRVRPGQKIVPRRTPLAVSDATGDIDKATKR